MSAGSALMDLIEGFGQPTPEQAREEHQRRFDRIRWAFNGDDNDSRIVNDYLDAVEGFHRVTYTHKEEDITGSMLVVECVGFGVKGMSEGILGLERLAATRVTAQGRWFSDPDGPDYAEPTPEPDNRQDPFGKVREGEPFPDVCGEADGAEDAEREREGQPSYADAQHSH